MKNLWLKTRKREHAYFVSGDLSSSWRWYVLKVYSDPRKPYARAFCCVVSPIVGERGELGDVYAKDVPGLIEAWTHAHYSPTREVQGDETKPRRVKPRSWRVVVTMPDGERCHNAMRFPSEDAAMIYGRELLARWTTPESVDVEPSNDPVTEKPSNATL